MKVLLISTSHQRKTGIVDDEVILQEKEISEDQYFKPLVQIFYKSLVNKGVFKILNQRGGGLDGHL